MQQMRLLDSRYLSDDQIAETDTICNCGRI